MQGENIDHFIDEKLFSLNDMARVMGENWFFSDVVMAKFSEIFPEMMASSFSEDQQKEVTIWQQLVEHIKYVRNTRMSDLRIAYDETMHQRFFTAYVDFVEDLFAINGGFYVIHFSDKKMATEDYDSLGAVVNRCACGDIFEAVWVGDGDPPDCDIAWKLESAEDEDSDE